MNNRAVVAVFLIAAVAGGGYLYFTYLQKMNLTINVVGDGRVQFEPEGPYSRGSIVSLSALPGEGWGFSSWSGGVSGKDPAITLRLDSDMAISATFLKRQKYWVNTQVTGSGEVKLDKVGPYYSGTAVVIMAFPSSDWEFFGWGGALSGTSVSTSMIVGSNSTIIAEFRKVIRTSVSVLVEGSGNVALDKIGPYLKDTLVTFTATPSTGYEFAGWSGDAVSSVNPLKLKMDSSKTITAAFRRIVYYSLDLSAIGQGRIEVNQTGPIRSGGVVSAKAIAVLGWRFNGWSGASSGTVNPITITMFGNVTLAATFVEDNLLVILTEGQGTVSKNVTGHVVIGQRVMLTAVPAENWTFKGWKELEYSSENPLSLTVAANTTITAVFIRQYFATIKIIGTGTVQRSESGPIDAGSTVSFKAIPASGWKFSSWSGSISSSENPIQVVMNGNKTITATFISSSSYRILVYSDESDDPGQYIFQNQPPVESLRNLDLSYVHSDYLTFLGKLSEGPWDLVIFKEEFQVTTSEKLDALSTYADSGRLIVSIWSIGVNPSHSLWEKLGVSYVGDFLNVDANQMYIWQASHPTVTTPNIITSPIVLHNTQFMASAGSFVNVISDSTMIIGGSVTPQNNKGLVSVNSSGRGVFLGVLPSYMLQDQNSDGKSDGTALYENFIQFVLNH